MKNGNMEIVPDLDNKKEEIAKNVLFHRGPIAAATNHTKGFHTHLKIISKDHKGIEYNLLKLIEKINKRYLKYASGPSPDKLCARVKKELLKMKNKFEVETVEVCERKTNEHKKLMLGSDLTCMHKVTDDSIIHINFPLFDEDKFYKYLLSISCTILIRWRNMLQ